MSEETKDIIVEQSNIEAFEWMELTDKIQYERCYRYMSLEFHMLPLWTYYSRSQRSSTANYQKCCSELEALNNVSLQNNEL